VISHCLPVYSTFTSAPPELAYGLLSLTL